MRKIDCPPPLFLAHRGNRSPMENPGAAATSHHAAYAEYLVQHAGGGFLQCIHDETLDLLRGNVSIPGVLTPDQLFSKFLETSLGSQPGSVLHCVAWALRAVPPTPPFTPTRESVEQGFRELLEEANLDTDRDPCEPLTSESPALLHKLVCAVLHLLADPIARMVRSSLCLLRHPPVSFLAHWRLARPMPVLAKDYAPGDDVPCHRDPDKGLQSMFMNLGLDLDACRLWLVRLLTRFPDNVPIAVLVAAVLTQTLGIPCDVGCPSPVLWAVWLTNVLHNCGGFVGIDLATGRGTTPKEDGAEFLMRTLVFLGTLRSREPAKSPGMEGSLFSCGPFISSRHGWNLFVNCSPGLPEEVLRSCLDTILTTQRPGGTWYGTARANCQLLGIVWYLVSLLRVDVVPVASKTITAGLSCARLAIEHGASRQEVTFWIDSLCGIGTEALLKQGNIAGLCQHFQDMRTFAGQHSSVLSPSAVAALMFMSHEEELTSTLVILVQRAMCLWVTNGKTDLTLAEILCLFVSCLIKGPDLITPRHMHARMARLVDSVLGFPTTPIRRAVHDGLLSVPGADTPDRQNNPFIHEIVSLLVPLFADSDGTPTTFFLRAIGAQDARGACDEEEEEGGTSMIYSASVNGACRHVLLSILWYLGRLDFVPGFAHPLAALARCRDVAMASIRSLNVPDVFLVDGGGSSLAMCMGICALFTATYGEVPPTLAVPELVMQIDNVRRKEDHKTASIHACALVLATSGVRLEPFAEVYALSPMKADNYGRLPEWPAPLLMGGFGFPAFNLMVRDAECLTREKAERLSPPRMAWLCTVVRVTLARAGLQRGLQPQERRVRHRGVPITTV